MKRLCLLLIFLSSCLLATRAQEDNSVSTRWQDYLSILVENEDLTADDYENISTQLADLAQNPLNLNTITEEQLSNLLFLNEYQVKEIVGYVRRYAPLRSWSELMMIRMLDPVRRGLLQSVTYLGPAPEVPVLTELDSIKFNRGAAEYRRWRNNDKGNIAASISTPFKSDESHAGLPLKYWARAKYTLKLHPSSQSSMLSTLSFGLLGAQDTGEPLRKSGLDYYTGYLQWKTYSKKLKTNVVVGRYRISTGMGLILNRNISFLSPISSLTSNPSTLTSYITPHLSRAEGTYLQGAAATLTANLSPLTLSATVFGSYRSIDATVSNNEITTILTTGYHRTESELLRRHNSYMASGGTSANLKLENLKLGTFNIGFTAVVNHYTLPLAPYTTSSQLYRKYMPSGQTFWNVSLEYGYSLGKRLSLTGETATGDCRQVATVNRLSWKLSSRLQLSALQRYYPYQFYATLGSSYASGSTNITGSNCQNESGVYLGGTWTPSSRFSLTAYSDFAYHAWYRYGKDADTHQWDNMFMLSWMPSPHSLFSAKIRLKENTKRFNLSHSLNLWNQWLIKPQLQLCFAHSGINTYGGIAPSIIGGFTAKHISINAGCTYFYTADYTARLYLYEQSTPYNFSSVQLSGQGTHFYALLKANGASISSLLLPLSVSLKYSGTAYFKYTTTPYSHNLQLEVSWQF